ncbi:hypothetical protein ACJRO7_013193 [Eucalyptus globulus]|uniref:Uncharacterized protein n=1 Tax=Eucalyptus globulus TaxID=34317 RepID=A0ABD3LL12_EUCGL
MHPCNGSLSLRFASYTKLLAVSVLWLSGTSYKQSQIICASADSKAVFLQNLCEELRFDPQKASEIHEEIYRQKLQQCVADGELSEENVKALLRVRVMLCISQQTVEAAHSSICGSLFEKVVKDAIASGVDGYDAEVKKSVRKAAHGLRLTREAAMSIASTAVSKVISLKGTGIEEESYRFWSNTTD